MRNHQCIKELTWKHKYWFSREYNLLSSSIFWNWSLRRDLVMPLVKLKNTSNQFELKSSNFYLTWHRWSTYNTTWKWRHCTPWSNDFFFLYSFMVAFVSTWGYFQMLQVSNIHLWIWILERIWELCLTKDSIFCIDSPRETNNDHSQTKYVDNKIWAW